jgi:protein TonB
MSNKVENFDEIIFENRNKDYGAYELRKKYSKRGSLALAVAIIILFVGVGAPLIASILNQKSFNKNLENTAEFILEDVNDIEEEKFIPPVQPEPPAAKEAIKFTAPVIVDSLDKESVEMVTVDMGIENSNTIMADTNEYDKVDFPIEIKPTFVEEIPFEIYQIEEEPKLEGINKFISENIQYPQEAIENDIQGTVYVRFVVESNGEVGDVILSRGVHELLDKEALRIVANLPKWIPGKRNGTPVSVWCSIPIKFTLE